jgi:hypothetical protein
MRAGLVLPIALVLLALAAAGCGRERAAPDLCDDAVASRLDPPLTQAEADLRRTVCRPPLPQAPGEEPLTQCEEGSTILTCPAGSHCDGG